MKEKTLKNISKLLVAIMIATIALPSGAVAKYFKWSLLCLLMT